MVTAASDHTDMSTSAPLIAAGSAPGQQRLKQLNHQLKQAKAERAKLEKLHEERCDLRQKIEALDAETAEAKAEVVAMTKKLEAEKRRQDSAAESSGDATSSAAAAAAAAGRSWVDPAKTEPMDVEKQSRAAEGLRQRRTRLTRLLEQLRDPGVIVREEDALRELNLELKQLSRSHQSHVRELALRGKQVEAGRAVRAANAKPLEMSAEETEEKEQDYVRRLTDMLATTEASHRKAKDQCEALLEQWEGWFSMLSTCSSGLQAKADAGDLSNFALPEGQSTPAFKVLEMCRDLEARHKDLRKRLTGQEAANETMKQKLRSMNEKISAQGLALKIDATRASNWNKRGVRRSSDVEAAGELKLPALA